MTPAGNVTISKSNEGPSRADIEAAQKVQQLWSTQLDRIRKAAEGWRNAQAGLFGLISILGAVKGPDSVNGLPIEVRVLIGLLLIAALTCAVVGVVVATRAAYGDPREDSLDGDLTERLESWNREELSQAISDVRRARHLTYVTIGLMMTAVVLAWYVPR